MRKENKKKLILIAVIFMSLGLVGFILIRATGIGSYSSVTGEVRGERNNIITFNGGYLHKYVHVMLESTKSENIKDDIAFEVINPKGQVVTEGKLYSNYVFRERYKNLSGEWKIVLYFKGSEEKSMINFGHAINSKDKSNMRID